MSIALCMATIQSVKTKFTEGKKLSTSHTTLQKISKIKCVERCSKEKQTGGCTLAGYNKATRTCYLSVDGPHDVLDTTDDMFGVFFYEPDQAGKFDFRFNAWVTDKTAAVRFLTIYKKAPANLAILVYTKLS